MLTSLPHALSVLTDPADCGPAVLALPQDVQAEAGVYPEAFFAPRVHLPLRSPPDPDRLAQAIDWLRTARRPLLIAGGGVHYAQATGVLAAFAERFGIPVAETQAGKGALPWDHASNAGAIGVTGGDAANVLAREADLVLAVGTRLADFTTASATLFRSGCRLVALNVCRHDAVKHGAFELRADARLGLEALAAGMGGVRFAPEWTRRACELAEAWRRTVERAVAPANDRLPGDAQVIGAVNAATGAGTTVVCAAGGLPGELHKLWRTAEADAYHLEYGYSCMGYEIAGGLGVKLARPDRKVVVMVGDGSYLMMNSEIATSVSLGLPLVIVLLDNGGFGCIERLQQSCGGESYNNLLDAGAPRVDFVAHAHALGADATKVDRLADLRAAVTSALVSARTTVLVIETDPRLATAAGGAWWDVPVAEVSASGRVTNASSDYRRARARTARTKSLE